MANPPKNTMPFVMRVRMKAILRGENGLCKPNPNFSQPFGCNRVSHAIS